MRAALRLLLLLLPLAAAAAAAEVSLAPSCPGSDEACCRYSGFTGNEHVYTLHNATNPNFLVLYTDQELVLKCKDESSSGLSLDDACMPRLSRSLAVLRVTLAGCVPGAGGSLARALHALGVRPSALRQLELRVPRATLLPGALLAEPEQLAELQMLAVIALDGALPDDAAAALERLPALSSLHVMGVRLPGNVSLPRSLHTLRLEGAGVELTREQLQRLPALAALSLRDAGLRAPPPLAAARALRFATIEAPLEGLPELFGVENITFRGASSLQWRGSCGALRRLRVAGGADGAGAPPARWLARCPGLQALAVTARGLGALPADLLDYTPDLRALDISNNKLTYLDSGMLQRLPRLEELDASRNTLTAAGVAPLRALPWLRVLVLDRNPLGDLCAERGRRLAVPVLSPLAELTALRRLALAGTGAQRVCADWPRRLPALSALDLSRNNVTLLQAEDLQWTVRSGQAGAAGAAQLDLRGNPLRALRLRRADYLQLPEEAQPVNVVVLADSALQCDCEAYWLVRALRERRLPARLRARCGPGPGPSLQQVPLQDMTCPIEESAGCPRGCRCAWRAHENATDVACARALALPDTRALPAARVRLRVPDGRLDALPPALPDNLVLLDVSGNNISTLSAALLRRGRRVRLARNPLRCACAHRALLLALAAHTAQVEDYAEVKCADGRWAGDAELLAGLAACGSAAGWLAPALALAGALLAAAAAAALLLRRSVLWRLKAHEMARALCPSLCLHSEPDDDSEYDVFLSFAHEDRAAAERVLRALEAPPRALRVCLHSRDWQPGGWIPDQIAHSVAVSRRTVVLLSERFARSAWARAELRLAAARALRDARPRLLVVLLDARPPPLDAELARYVSTHTYLSARDPQFCDKLRHALQQPPRAPRAPDATDASSVPESVAKSIPSDILDRTKPDLAVTSPCA